MYLDCLYAFTKPNRSTEYFTTWNKDLSQHAKTFAPVEKMVYCLFSFLFFLFYEYSKNLLQVWKVRRTTKEMLRLSEQNKCKKLPLSQLFVNNQWFIILLQKLNYVSTKLRDAHFMIVTAVDASFPVVF